MELRFTILICDLAYNLIAINRLHLAEVQDLSKLYSKVPYAILLETPIP